MSGLRESAQQLEVRLAEMDRALAKLEIELTSDDEMQGGEDDHPAAPRGEEPPPDQEKPDPPPPRREERRGAPSSDPTPPPLEEPPRPGGPSSPEGHGRSGPLADLLRRQAEGEPPSGVEGESPPEPDAPAEIGAPPSATEALVPAQAYASQVLVELYDKLLASMRELLDGYDALLAPLRGAARPTPPSSGSPGRAGARVSVSAGPFRGTAELRDFAQALAGIRGVSDVTVRGYEGADSAILEVRLQDPERHRGYA